MMETGHRISNYPFSWSQPKKPLEFTETRDWEGNGGTMAPYRIGMDLTMYGSRAEGP